MGLKEGDLTIPLLQHGSFKILSHAGAARLMDVRTRVLLGVKSFNMNEPDRVYSPQLNPAGNLSPADEASGSEVLQHALEAARQ